MSRLFTDDSLLTWEAYPTGGRFGFPDAPKIVFNCLSQPDRRARYVQYDGVDSNAERAIMELSEHDLKGLLGTSRELD